MTQRRCFLPDLHQPGSLQLLTISLDGPCAPLQRSCLKEALAKWQSLFTVQIIEYSLSDMGVILLAYIPNQLLSEEEARQRVERFDRSLQECHKGLWALRPHRYSPEKLNNLSAFMQNFVRDFMQRHRRQPIPKDLPEGMPPYPRKKGGYKAKTVCHTALPPIFSADQHRHIFTKLKQLGFFGGAKMAALQSLHTSPHGIGPRIFLDKLELQCLVYLLSTHNAGQFGLLRQPKNIVPFNPDIWDRRLGELARREPYEYYTRAWHFLMDIGMAKDALSRWTTFRVLDGDPRVAANGPLWACMPVTLTLMLCDGLLRWYYKKQKNIEFPRYNYYRELKPYEYLP